MLQTTIIIGGAILQFGGGISTPNVEDPTVNPTLSVTYYFQATDAIGCRSNIDSVVVDVKPRPKSFGRW